MDVTGKPQPPLPTFDFWLYDDSRVARLDYRMDGTQIGRELIEDADLTQYFEWRDYALKHSVPFLEYAN